MLLSHEDSQLVLVDYQVRLLPCLHQGLDALANAVRLAKGARAFHVPVWGTEQAPEKLGASMPELAGLVTQMLTKTDFSAADILVSALMPILRTPQGNARSLPKHLQKPQVPAPERCSVVLAGCEAHVCLLQTALDLLDREMEVWVVTDACASRTERNRDAAFDRLAGNGAELVTTEMVLFEWLRTSQHPNHKVVQALIN
ncbi:MAG: isochorismatase family protein [Betaproteobacteria bacterium]|jgi:nicotinamidase-related amidase|nr:isochorismatase family protein [Betaproteobacteria bacterium]MBK7655063.1 isochorismatase family protein [Betaproteobacteria bacterium]MBP6644259.1 isochorismatase family protein [Burkholderiaceae bacterium]